jgi:flagellar hook assembly protein FlgD
VKKPIAYLSFAIVLVHIEYVTADTFDQYQIDGGQWRLSKDYINYQSNGECDLFGAVGESAALMEWRCNQQPSQYLVQFVTDPYWHRIIYGVDNLWGRAYGSYGGGNGQFKQPQGITASPEGLVFIADKGNGRVSVFFYSYPNVLFNSNISVSPRPIDVCWDDAGTAEYNCYEGYDDYLWVLCENGTVYKFEYEFNRYDQTFHYRQLAEYQNLVDLARSIAKGRSIDNLCPDCDELGNDYWLYLSNGANQVYCYSEDTYFHLEFSYTLPENTMISSIDVSPLGTIWVTDLNSMRVLKYYNNESTLIFLDEWGVWGTDNDAGQLAWPRSTTFAMRIAEDWYHPPNLIYNPPGEMAIGERWTATTGGIRGRQGVAIKNLLANLLDPLSRTVVVSFDKTAFNSDFREQNQAMDIEIKNSSDETIRTLEYVDPPGHVEVEWDGRTGSPNGPQAPIDVYTFEVSAYIFGSWTTEAVSCNTNSAPYFEVFELDRYGCVVNSQDSRVITYQVIDPNPEDTQFSYHWNVNNGTFASIDPPGHYGQDFTYRGDGDGMILWHPPGDWDMGAAPGPENANIVCTVKDLYPEGVYLSAIKGKNLWHCGEGCPFIYVLNGSDTLIQNNILNASIDTSGEGNLVFDYLFLNDDPQPSGFHYDFFIREDGLEKDSLDWVNLITIDHTTGSEVILSPAGDIYERLLTVSPSAAVDDRGIDVLAELQYPDGIYYTRSDSGWIDVTFDGLDTLSLALDSIPSGTIVMSPEKAITGGSTPGGPDPNIVTILIEVSPDNREPVDRIFPRAGKSHPSFIDLSEYFSDKMHVRYSWTRGYHADFVGYGWVRRITDGISFLQPSTAVFYDTVDVLSLVKKADNLFVGFEVAGFVNLSFPYEQIPGGKTRDFVFLCRGKYYTSDSLGSPKPAGDLLPRELGLSQNYPNPFNSTTIIKFATPIDQHISIEVFDILGRKVVTLLSEKVQAGYYEIFWEGQNSAGEAISSGIYFYKLRTVDKQILKKMLLLK